MRKKQRDKVQTACQIEVRSEKSKSVHDLDQRGDFSTQVLEYFENFE